MGRCIDETFTRFCNGLFEKSPPITIGITYYGTMQASETIIETEVSEGQTIAVPLPHMNFTPNGVTFARAIKETIVRYPHTRITIAEIGLSSGETQKAGEWLTSYIRAIKEIRHSDFQKHVMVHTVFESAEFSPGEWFFHVLNGCEPGQVCQFTRWGETLLQHIETE